MCQHVMQFYDEAYPAEAVSGFFAAGLAAGDRCLAVLTAPHHRAVEQCLRVRGIQLEEADYIAVDTDEVLSMIRTDGRLDLVRANELLAPLMEPPAGKGMRRVHAVGDIAPTLCAMGNTDDAVAIEGLVHRLTALHGGATLCAYPVQRHAGDGSMRGMLRLIAEHAAIDFPQAPWVQHLMPAAPPQRAQSDRF